MEPERLGEWIDRLGGGLALFARQWCDSPEDVVQEAFVALTLLAEEPTDPAGWLYRAVRNRAINLGIADQRRRRREAKVGREAPRWFDPTASPGSTPHAIDPDTAQDALEALPIAEREVIVAHLWGGLTFDQVAALVGTSSSSAHRLYQLGLTRLRQELGAPPCPAKTSTRPKP